MVIGCNLTQSDNSPLVNQLEYTSMIGILLYVTGKTRDIMHLVGIVGRFQENPKETHLQEVKIIFKYIQGATSNLIFWSIIS